MEDLEMGTLYFRDGHSMLMILVSTESQKKMKVRRLADVTKWNWYWLDGNNNRWNQFDAEVSRLSTFRNINYLAI
jgi:hypothetical protein